jgi:hypothetical protein
MIRHLEPLRPRPTRIRRPYKPMRRRHPEGGLCANRRCCTSVELRAGPVERGF